MNIFKVIPAPVHRAILPLAHKIRHRWRKWRRTPIAGVSVVISDFGGSILLLRHSYGPDVWALPSGGLRKGEDAAEGARREINEELGMELASLTALGTIEEDLSGAPHTAYLFSAICDNQPRPDGREVVEARFFPTHSLPEPLGKHTRQRLSIWQERRTH